ncbi:hypothetical protein [Flavobacterium sp. '19STA2R22 D10 B1']|uniref:hypothetical protein n=1 Tax=Flavobacterium aerium TaxID=3037261 RepID=UPI00278BE261|nr:hypothetical protein [Flavobacterium sp. '19STA2R22 D10 B1']
MSNTIMHPSLSQLLPLDKIPNEIEAIRDALISIFDDIYVKNLIASQSYDGSSGFYSLTLTSYNSIGIDIPIEKDLRLVLNPATSGSTEIPISFDYSWIILRYINNFNFESFDNTVKSVLNVLLELSGINHSQYLREVLIVFYPGGEGLENFVQEFNTNYGQNITISDDDFYSQQEKLDLVLNKIDDLDFNIIEVTYESVIEIDGLNRVKKLFARFFDNIEENLKEALELNFNAVIHEISIGLQFPRKWLVPVYTGIEPVPNLGINDPLPDNYFSYLKFNAGSLEYSSKRGFEFNNLSSFDLNRSMIGNTGLIAEFSGLKIDLNKDKNIPEADADGRPKTFKGVYADYAAITLPKLWFKEDNGQTLRIAGRRLLIGSGGVSGTIILETVNGTPATSDDFFWFKIGGDNGFSLGFNRFDITFKQNVVVASNIRGALKIPKFKNKTTGLPLHIDVAGHLYEDGDFNLTAAVEGGLQANLFDFVNFNFLTFELGKDDNTFYVGTSCEIWFDNAIMTKLIGNQKIIIPNIRLYSNGHIEIVGGNGFIPSNITIDLGPVKMVVTGIHFGAHERNGRKYNYWGFNGAISMNPLALDARGQGIKYYYTIDNDEYNGVGDSYISISSIEIDMIIPGGADPTNALAIIHGSLTIPDPGETREYRGSVSLELPKAKVKASAAMHLQPKEPAFIIDVSLDQLPAPIPIGPIAIYGFKGLLGYRYVAEKEAVGLVSGVNTWYDYYVYPPRGIHVSKFSGPNKTKDYSTPFSVGVGAILGTSFDDGTVISVRAMMLLSLPTLFMIEGRASILASRLGLDDLKEPPFFAFVAWGDSSIEMGMGADYKLPKRTGKIFDLHAQVEARFMFNNNSAWYVNIGTREKPNTATLFRDVINLRALSYLMISAQGVQIGAATYFEIKKNVFGIKVLIRAGIEAGGRVSFERPQMGGYLYFGGKIDVNVWRLISAGFSLDVFFSAEAVKPFLIAAKIHVAGRIRVFRFIKIKFSIRLAIEWRISNEVDTSPIAALPFENIPENNSVNRTEELVKGIHMLTNEIFEIKYLGKDLMIVDPESITQVIPLDTYIDIKSVKGLIPVNVSQKLGGYTTAPSNYVDLIPPVQTVPGGHVLRQVKHKYSIDKIEVKAWDGTNWIDYHPYEALVEEGPKRNEVSNLKIGYWQHNGNGYNTIRLLANNPFSYLDGGQPGWFIPEHYGITPSTLFCETKTLKYDVMNVLNKTLGKLYFYDNAERAYFINGIYCKIIGVFNEDFTLQNNIIPVDCLKVTDELNVYDYAQSLSFTNYNHLVLILPENSVDTKLKLSSNSLGVRIKYYSSYISPNHSRVQYQLIEELYKTGEELNIPIVYSNTDQPIIKIVIEPITPVSDQVRSIREEIEALFTQTYSNSDGIITLIYPSDKVKYDLLMVQLLAVLAQGCSASENPCSNKDEKLCNLYNILLSGYCFTSIASVDELNMSCYAQFQNFIKGYETTYPGIVILLQPYYNNFSNALFQLTKLVNDGVPFNQILSAYNLLSSIAGQIMQVLQEKGHCSCKPEDEIKCITSLQELEWLTLEKYEYNSLIPDSAAQMADQLAMEAAIEKMVQPIWRPNTKYYVSFKLIDEVNNGAGYGTYNYFYGFKTAGGVGYFHDAPGVTYGNEYDINGTIINRPNGKLLNPEGYSLTSLREYIDYNRSYPNADSNLLQSKPLFWGHYECKITIFFTKPLTYHMLSSWPKYMDLPALEGSINIKIKDPISNVLIPYPLPIEFNEETVPIPVGNGAVDSIWIDDNDPRIPADIQLLNALIENGDIPCQLHIGDAVIPESYAYSVKLTNLKPQKLYTALVYSAFDVNSNGSLDENENVEVHSFVFQTSRYETFEKQINSYILKDEEGNQKPAIFKLSISISSQAVSNAFDIISGTNVNVLPNLITKYSHLFDRVLEGVFLLKPLEFATTTEFNVIRNEQTNQLIALLIRNPEPFNNPKIPVGEIQNTIIVLNNNNEIDPNYKMLYSKDYAQVLIMKIGNVITEPNLKIRFQYKEWNGTAYTPVGENVTVIIDINA